MNGDNNIIRRSSVVGAKWNVPARSRAKSMLCVQTRTKSLIYSGGFHFIVSGLE